MSNDVPEPDPTQKELHINARPDQMGGVYANFGLVKHSIYEFTLDFVRLDFNGDVPTNGTLVQRVNLSPLFVRQLMDALEENWQAYAAKALPPEAKEITE